MTAISKRSASAITRNCGSAALIFLFLFPLFLLSQKDDNALSEKERRRFNEMFFEAEKQMNIGDSEKAQKLYEDLYKADPKNATVNYELAQIYANQNEQEDAVFHGKKAAELEPKNKWFQLLLAGIYRNFRRTDDEIKTFRKLINLEPENPDFRYELAMTYLNEEKYDSSISVLDGLEEMLGVNEMISDQKKDIYLQQGDLDGAVSEIRKLIDAFPKNMDYYGTLGQLFSVNGREEEALKVYQKMLEIAPEDPRPHLDLAQYHRAKGDYEKSLFHLKKAMANPDLPLDSKIPVLLSLFEPSSRDTALKKEAYEMLETLTEQNPENPKAYAIYGDFLSRDGRNQEALSAYKKAVKMEGGGRFDLWQQILLIEIQTEEYDSLQIHGPQAIELFPNQSLPYYFTGAAFLQNGNAEEATYYLEDGLNYVIGNPQLKEQFYVQLADAHNRLGKSRKSDDYFDKILSLNPNNSTALNNYAYYLSVRGDNLDKALEMTEKSNRLSANNATFLDTWAWVLYKKGDYQKALEKMEKVVSFPEGNNGEVREHYGDILYKLGKIDEAISQWKKAQELGGTSEFIEQKIQSGKIVE